MIIPAQEMDFLRFLAAGSVDDGKSTLIGRLLYESGGVYDDQLHSVRQASAVRNLDLDLSLITDGLRAEREQGITIDVAYRYFSTQRRKFIIADAPGHVQYTRNMATGASNSDLAIILLDARKGVLRQSKRHTLIASLMGIRQMIIAVNKMDLVDYDHARFDEIRRHFARFATSLKDTELHFIPLSALLGDNVIMPSNRMPWYDGQSLLELLETLPVPPPRRGAFRFPIQTVVRPHQDFRGYAGQVISGTASRGREIIALPSGRRTRIQEVLLHSRSLERAETGVSAVLTVDDHLDLGRGDMLVDANDPPTMTAKIIARLVWLDPKPLAKSARYLIKHTTNTLCGRVARINHKIDISTFRHLDARELHSNEIGEVELDLNAPIFCDRYADNRQTGSFILIDPNTYDTVAAGVIADALPQRHSPHPGIADRTSAGFRQGLTVWFTGLSGAGKTTVCRAVASELLSKGLQVEVIDGDIIRNELCRDLGFSKADRDENIRRIAFIAKMLTRNGVVVLVSAISPYRAARDSARQSIGNFLEVYINTPLEVCELRDPKLLYQKARSGQLPGFTGIDDPYEPPLEPELTCNTADESTRASCSAVCDAVLQYLTQQESLARVVRSSPNPRRKEVQ